MSDNMMNICLIAGVINAGVINAVPNQCYFWLGTKSTDCFKINDYAIVENKQGYDLVKIVGIVWTDEANLKTISKNSLKKMKKVIRYIPREEIENE